MSPLPTNLGTAINAMTMGVEEPFIVIYAGLLERMSEEEIFAILAHEVGHIHNQHLLYTMAARTLLMLMATLLGRTPVGGLINTIGIPIQIALLMWYHKAELSCDRTAVLVTQNPLCGDGCIDETGRRHPQRRCQFGCLY